MKRDKENSNPIKNKKTHSSQMEKGKTKRLFSHPDKPVANPGSFYILWVSGSSSFPCRIYTGIRDLRLLDADVGVTRW
jgi:hypothetical protein